MYRRLGTFILFISFSITSLIGQVKVIQVLSESDHVPVPFAQIVLSDSSYRTNTEGVVYIDSVQSVRCQLYHPYYDQIDTMFSLLSDTAHLLLRPRELLDLKVTEQKAIEIVRKVSGQSTEHNFFVKKHFKYTSYNKARVSTNNIKGAKGVITKVLDMFSIGLKSFTGNHHILLAESVTKREYVNEFNQKEYIVSSKISGIDNPKMLALNSQIQSLSIYEKFIKVIDKSYVSPVFKGAETRYNFKVLRTIKRANDELYIIQFTPNGKLKQVLLTGVLYVSSNKWAVESAIIRPDKSSAAQFDVYFNYAYENDMWVPHSFTTKIGLDNVTSKKFKFITRYSTYIYDFEYNASLDKSIWDDVSIEFIAQENESGTDLIKQSRKEVLSKRDKNTYAFYDTVGTLNNIDLVFDFAEHLYDKEIKTKYFNVDLNRAFDYNHYEGLRVGIGANTYLDDQERFKVGGHMAYGLSDNDAKYGLSVSYKLLPLNKLTFVGGYDNETFESAYSTYSFYRYQYSTEWLRRFSINVMDVAKRYYVGFETSPIKYTSLSFKLMSSNNFTPYNYQYKENITKKYQYTDLELGLRFAFGEQYFKLYNNKYRLKTHYPILWTKLNFGLNDFLGGEYKYVKIDSRVEYTMRSFLMGTGKIQFNFGHAVGELPYFQLFEGYGAQGAAVAHNRFETMGINEFLSSSYVNLFLTYEIAKLYFRSHPTFRPSIELDYNFGIGTLKNKEDHKEFDFKTMEKTYHETGVSIRNLVTFKLVAAKIGLGVGNYLRFGPYSYASFKDNYNAKVFVTFAL